MRVSAEIDIDEAYAAVGDVLAVWREVSRWSDAPPFTGGVFDAWPRRIAAGIAFLRGESQSVTQYLLYLERKESKHG